MRPKVETDLFQFSQSKVTLYRRCRFAYHTKYFEGFTRRVKARPLQFGIMVHEMLEAGLFDLIAAFKELLDRRKALLALDFESQGKSLEQRIEELMAEIRQGESLELVDLFSSQETKAGMILTFLALLELIRLNRIRIYQRILFGPIRVFRPVGPEGKGPTHAAADRPGQG